LNNEPASINIVADTAVGQKTTTTGEGAGATATQEAERMTTGTSLTVVPQVNPDGYITMTIEPSVTRAVASGTFTGNPVFLDPETRSAKTTVMIKDGQTVVIGGLITRDVTRVNRKVPILGDIPLLGLAFRHKSDQEETKELIIFLTPHVLGDDETMMETAGNMEMRFTPDQRMKMDGAMSKEIKGLSPVYMREQEPLR